MATKVRVAPSQGATNWSSGFGASGAKYQAGVQNVQSAPNAAAAAALPRWVASVTSQAVQQKYVQNNNSVSLSDWQNATIQYGVPNLTRGATKGANKYTAFATKFYPYLSTGLAQVAAMPNTTLQDRIARSVAMMTYNAGYKGS